MSMPCSGVARFGSPFSDGFESVQLESSKIFSMHDRFRSSSKKAQMS